MSWLRTDTHLFSYISQTSPTARVQLPAAGKERRPGDRRTRVISTPVLNPPPFFFLTRTFNQCNSFEASGAARWAWPETFYVSSFLQERTAICLYDLSLSVASRDTENIIDLWWPLLYVLCFGFISMLMFIIKWLFLYLANVMATNPSLDGEQGVKLTCQQYPCYYRGACNISWADLTKFIMYSAVDGLSLIEHKFIIPSSVVIKKW